jgi:hypothetical protein
MSLQFSPSIDLDALMDQVNRQHVYLLARRKDPTIADPEAIGDIADRYAREWADPTLDDIQIYVAVIRCASRMIYCVQHYGMTFEEVCDMSELSIARAVCMLSPDPRIGTARRHQALRSAIVTAEEPEKLAKLAELRAAADLTIGFTPFTYKDHGEAVRVWVEDCRDLLAAFEDPLCQSPFFRSEVKEIDRLFEEAGRPLDLARTPRRK